MIHHAFLRKNERTNAMPSMYDIFDITSLEKKRIELISSSSIWHEKLEAVMKITHNT